MDTNELIRRLNALADKMEQCLLEALPERTPEP